MENSDDLFYTLMKVYLAQMDSAIKISSILQDHSESDELSGDDIISGLVYRLMTPMSQVEITESLTKAGEILDDDEEGDEEGDVEEDYDDISETYDKPTISRKIKTNNCNCEICSQVRICLDNYHSYIPTDNLAVKFKDSIQETCDKHKIYI
jgi:hypothetical protein